jgi:hypothetical protein
MTLFHISAAEEKVQSRKEKAGRSGFFNLL